MHPAATSEDQLARDLGPTGPVILGAVTGRISGAVVRGASTLTAARELIPTHGMTMSRSQFAALKQDIAKNGIKDTIKYVNLNGRKYVVDGHHRLLAARELGISNVPAEEVRLPYLGYGSIGDLFDRGW